jgi:hypothetical protein
MAGSRSDSNQSGSVDWGVIPCGLEEAMAVRIALRRFREDNARPTDGSIWRDSVASAQRALGSSGDGSLPSQQSENLSFPITGRADYESQWERAAHRGKEKLRDAEAPTTATEAADATTWAAAEEEAIHTRIVKKLQKRNTRALAREQNREVRAMAGLPPNEKEDSEDSSGDEQIRLDPYCIFDRYFREKDDKGVGKGKGSRR